MVFLGKGEECLQGAGLFPMIEEQKENAKCLFPLHPIPDPTPSHMVVRDME